MKFFNQIFLILFYFFFFSVVKAQDLSQPIQSPKKAAMLSAALPGFGQVYNKKYWKVPIIYAGLLTSAYYINDNHVQYKHYKEAYLIRIDSDPNTTDDFVGEYSSGDLIILKDFYRRNREISILCLVGTYILNIVDASVDAHLFYYDISEDISLNITPTSTKEFSGISLTLNL
ncbi:MAG TPA: DUF5683 domain-containing protein [Flavobacteriales bacterium]|nr:DUF5683 domain-containing protein [Flavobacteriales bacterium]HJN63304.1 DUF5683 domain-containing protein [Flavobacteriales bacterium]